MFRAAIIADYEAWQAWFVATGEKTSTRVNRESCRKHVRACVRACVRAWAGLTHSMAGEREERVNKNRADCLIKERTALASRAQLSRWY